MRIETNVNKLIENLRDDPEGFGVAVSNLDVLTLRKLIDKADSAYYRLGMAEIMTDAEYDLLRPALKELDPSDERITRVGVPYDASELRNKVKHSIPMGSLDNTDDGIAGYGSWYQKMLEKIKAQTGTNLQVMASLKVDGGSVRARYEDGKLVLIATRGNGEIGEDITANGVMFQYLPTELPESLTLDVRGEAVLYVSDYKEIKEAETGIPFDQIPVRDQSNPRNIGNGVFGRDDGKDSDKIRFLAFNVEGAEDQYSTESEKYEFLKRMGFQVVPHKLCSDTEDVMNFYNTTADGRSKLPFEIDGVVVALDNHAFQQAFITKDIKSRLRPKFARAIKFPHKSGTTTLESVTLSHGHTCGIFPTANLKEVRIGGVNVTHALLNNWDEIERLGVQIGDEVEVVLAGDIIPKIIRVVQPGQNRQPIKEPSRCPACGNVTTRNLRGKPGAITYCTNSECPPAMMGKIDHWIGTAKKGVGILGIGDTMLKALWDEEIIKEPADLYTMKVADIENITLDGGGRIGKSRATKVVKEIKDKAKMTLSMFLGSLGIELLGRRRVTQLQEAADGQLDTLEQWLDTTTFANLKIPGLGETIRGSIVAGIDANRGLIEKLVQNGVVIDYPVQQSESDDLPFSGLSFCLTGTRAYIDDIARLGGTVKSGVSKTLDFLVQKDPMSASNKTKKADGYGVAIIGIDFLKKAVDGEVDLHAFLEGREEQPASMPTKSSSNDIDELASELTS